MKIFLIVAALTATALGADKCTFNKTSANDAPPVVQTAALDQGGK